MSGSLRHRSGFTLIEVLAALMIMAILATASFSGLDIIGRSAERLEQERQTLTSLAFFFEKLEHDLANAVNIPSRQSRFSIKPPLEGGGSRIVFTRMGDDAEVGGRHVPRRVGYEFSNGRVSYTIWPAVDAPYEVPPAGYTAIEGMMRMDVSFLDQMNQWKGAWGEKHLPKAVKVTVTYGNGEKVWRLFDFPDSQ
ncbi:MAG: GspJ family type II secretion system protein [Nitrospinota bacterium]|nr:GspJ family type II secretion system protein [Nitrospinota bacterium]